MKWRMPEMCDNCPFASKGPGLHLRKLLRPGRWQEIINNLRNDGHFMCHKTTHGETGVTGQEKLCAGAMQWQEKRGLGSNLVRVLTHMFGY